MTRIDRLWVVRNPTSPESELADCCFEATPSEFASYAAGVFGSNAGDSKAWTKYEHALYTDGGDALQDAMTRLYRR